MENVKFQKEVKLVEFGIFFHFHFYKESFKSHLLKQQQVKHAVITVGREMIVLEN